MKERLLLTAYGAGLAAIGLLGASLCSAASIPAWLDDAITEWNEENPAVQIQFVDIKDQFVWYMIPNTPETSAKRIRERVYAIAQAHGYKMTAEEELVTTGRPPSPTGPPEAKKCWNRSFTLDVDVGRQRLLTTLVCEDAEHRFAGFRIVE
jgi:hypothetical protein